MSEKTNYWLLVPCMLALCLAIITLSVSSYFSFDLFFSTVALELGISAIQSINKFSSGAVGSDPFWYKRLLSLANILLIFVVGPVLWFAGSKREKGPKSVLWYVGVTLILIGFLTVGTGLSSYIFNAGDQLEASDRNQNRDLINSELLTLGNKAMELYWLPENKNKLYQNLSNVRLSDLKAGRNFINSYQIGKRSNDSTLYLYGVGIKEGHQPDFKNANGAKGQVQAAVKVNATSLQYEWLKADSLIN